MPSNFRKFSVRLLRLFRRLFENKPEKRPAVTETLKYLKDTWINSKLQSSSSAPLIPGVATETFVKEEAAIPSECKLRAKKMVNNYGLETKIDQNVITKRIWEWISNCESYQDNNFEGI